MFIFLIYSLNLCWGHVSNSNVTRKFTQLHYLLSQNIGGDKRYYVPYVPPLNSVPHNGYAGAQAVNLAENLFLFLSSPTSVFLLNLDTSKQNNESVNIRCQCIYVLQNQCWLQWILEQIIQHVNSHETTFSCVLQKNLKKWNSRDSHHAGIFYQNQPHLIVVFVYISTALQQCQYGEHNYYSITGHGLRI